MSGASERANGRASGPVLTSLFLFVPDHSALPIFEGHELFSSLEMGAAQTGIRLRHAQLLTAVRTVRVDFEVSRSVAS